jgi:hypothetical protein
MYLCQQNEANRVAAILRFGKFFVAAVQGGPHLPGHDFHRAGNSDFLGQEPVKSVIS